MIIFQVKTISQVKVFLHHPTETTIYSKRTSTYPWSIPQESPISLKQPIYSNYIQEFSKRTVPERTPKSEYLISLVTYLGVRWSHSISDGCDDTFPETLGKAQSGGCREKKRWEISE